MIRFHCSFCKDPLQADDTQAGSKMVCTGCRCLTRIPNLQVRAAPADSPAALPTDAVPARLPLASAGTGQMPLAHIDYVRHHLEMEIPPSVPALGPIETQGFTQRPERAMAWTFIAFFDGLGLIFLVMVALTTSRLDLGIRLAICGGILAGMCLVALCMWGVCCGFRRFACIVCARGFLWRRGRVLRVYRWEQVQAPYLDFTVITEKVNGQPVQRNWYSFHRLVMDDGQTLYFPDEFPGSQDVYRAMAEHFYRLGYPPAAEAIRAGRHFAFGDQLALGPDTLIWRGQRIPWHAVSHFSTWDEGLYLHLHGDPQVEALGSSLLVPNVEVFINLGNALAEAARDRL
jgi:hypothetical protein